MTIDGNNIGSMSDLALEAEFFNMMADPRKKQRFEHEMHQISNLQTDSGPTGTATGDSELDEFLTAAREDRVNSACGLESFSAVFTTEERLIISELGWRALSKGDVAIQGANDG